MASNEFEDVIDQMTLSEKVSLLSGIGACRAAPLERLNIPTINVSDGPHGLRGGGGRFFNPPPGYQTPCATALGASFDTELMYHLGKLLGDEGRRKNIQVALAPTVCIQRSPLIGRGFEAFGEDPILSGEIAAQYINGLQDRGVAACVKHYAAHDQSTRSKEDDVHMTERTLREVHLLPFQLTMAKSRPWSFMSAYQKINGLHASEDPFLLQKILRDDWGFDGLVMSDWWGTYSTSEAVNAGLDLEMPGPSVWRGQQLMDAVECRKVRIQTINTCVRNVLKLAQRTQAGNSLLPDPSGSGDTLKSRALLRKIAAESIVLLKNEKKLLPLNRDGAVRYGLIGEHFENPATCGGGSSEATAFYISTPIGAFAEVLGTQDIPFEPGCYSRRWTPLIQKGLSQPSSEKPGLFLEWFGEDPYVSAGSKCLYSTSTTCTNMYFSQMIFEGVPDIHFIRVTSTFTASKTCRYRFALSIIGKGRLIVDGKEAIDLWTSHPAKTDETPAFNKYSMERHFDLDVEEGQEYELVIYMTNSTLRSNVGPPSPGGIRLGGQELRDEDEAIKAAVQLAKRVDVPIILTGLSSDYEYEGSDRQDLALPGRLDKMIRRVCEANSNTIVITQSGLPITMPWIEKVSTLVHAWYGGQETGHAITDILFGKTNPSGRLSVTFPERLQDTPAFLNFGKTDRHIVYGEGVFVGHRYYEKRETSPLFYFGYGLSYTHFEYSKLVVSSTVGADHSLKVAVDIFNTGEHDGSEVVQIYVADLECSVQRPVKELKAFRKIRLVKGEKQTCEIILDKYALSFWSEEESQWRAEAGDFAVIVARSSDPKDEVLRDIVRLEKSFSWSGV